LRENPYGVSGVRRRGVAIKRKALRAILQGTDSPVGEIRAKKKKDSPEGMTLNREEYKEE